MEAELHHALSRAQQAEYELQQARDTLRSSQEQQELLRSHVTRSSKRTHEQAAQLSALEQRVLQERGAEDQESKGTESEDLGRQHESDAERLERAADEQLVATARELYEALKAKEQEIEEIKARCSAGCRWFSGQALK